MSRRGNCWDNAVIESFFKSFKSEEVYQLTRLISGQQMKWLIAEYIGHYNNVRPYSYNDYIAPAKFEALRLECLAEIEKCRYEKVLPFQIAYHYRNTRV